MQVTEFSQFVADFLGNGAAKVLIAQISTHVGKREHGN